MADSDWSVEGALSGLKDRFFPPNPDDVRMAQAQKDAEDRAAKQRAAEAAQSAPTPLARFLSAARGPAVDNLVGAPDSTPAKAVDVAPDPVVAPPPATQQATPKSTGRVSVSAPSSDGLTYRPFQSLSNLAPRPDSAPAPGGQAEAPKRDIELEDAQRTAGINRALSHVGGVIDRGARLSIGAPTDGEVFERGEKQAEAPVQQILQRREAAAKQVQDDSAKLQLQQQRDSLDPNSDLSKRAGDLAVSFGMIKPSQRSGFAASMFPMMKEGASLQQAKEQHAAELASHEKEADLGRRSQAALENQRFGHEVTLHKIDDESRERQKLAGKGALKEIPSAELLSLSGAGPGAQEVVNQADAFGKVGGFGLVGGDSAKFKKGREAGALKIAIGENPKARESLSAKTEGLADTYLPAASDTHGTGYDKLGNSLLRMNTGANDRLSSLQGYDTSPLENDRRQVRASTQEFLQKHGAKITPQLRTKLQASAGLIGPHGQTVNQGGHTFTWNPSSGQYE